MWNNHRWKHPKMTRGKPNLHKERVLGIDSRFSWSHTWIRFLRDWHLASIPQKNAWSARTILHP
jgi:hypothetical protein